jgi:hypothetical protein
MNTAKMVSFLLLVSAMAVLTRAGATPLPDDLEATRTLQATASMPLDARKALMCEAIADFAAYMHAKDVRANAERNDAVSKEGLDIYRELRLTEGLASAAFDAMEPAADHLALYFALAAKFRGYVEADAQGAQMKARKLMPVCGNFTREMLAARRVAPEQAVAARQTSDDAAAALAKELVGQGYAVE